MIKYLVKGTIKLLKNTDNDEVFPESPGPLVSTRPEDLIDKPKPKWLNIIIASLLGGFVCLYLFDFQIIEDEDVLIGETWLSIGMVADELELHPQTINRSDAIERNGSRRVKFDKEGRVTYIDKNIVYRIKAEFTSKEWESPTTLASQYGFSKEAIEEFVEPFRISNPDWFRYGRTLNSTHQRYSRELQDKIRYHFGYLRDGIRSTVIARKHSMTKATVEMIAEKFRGTHPQWFLVNRRGFEAYHPNLEKRIDNALGNRHYYVSIEELLRDLESEDREKASDYIWKFYDINPEWFLNIRNADSVHPDLVDKARDYINTRARARKRIDNNYN